MLARNKGSTGIPIFRTRIALQQPEQLGSNNLEYPDSGSEVSRKPCKRDIGKKVRVEDKEGTLRFFGRVHFGTGVWCGIELSRPIGKHDGHVLGVRYFFCANLCGLMAPLTKVALVDHLLVDSPSDKESGPHSILFGIEEGVKKDKSKKRQYVTHTESSSPSPNTKIVKNNTNPFLTDLTECSNFPDIVNSTRVAPKVEDAYVLTPERSDVTYTTAFSSTYDSKNPFISCSNYDIITDKTYSKDELDLSLVEIRRGTYSLQQDEAQILKSTLESNSSSGENTLESESNSAESVRRLSFMFMNPYCDDSLAQNIRPKVLLSQSTPKKESEIDIECSPRRRCRRNVATTFTAEEDANKRDSLELDESLGILTPDQMADFSGFVETKEQSKKNSLGVHELNVTLKGEDGLVQITQEDGSSKSCTIGSLLTPDIKADFVSSPVNVAILDEQQPTVLVLDKDQSVINDLSLGIIDVNSLTKSDTTMNMDLPLDPADPEQRLYTTIRFEQTPSPEDLPLDPTPTLDSEPKTEPSHSKTTTSNFIMSITSITSLDTGYQGDGEMSRPASRGADHSPLFKRPLPRRAIDPMTDSDFYTESDADNHEEHNVRGDRRAQIIDGTLYGIDAQAAADIYVNNRENMDSSGIFTDIEANKVDDSSESLSRVIRTDVSPTASDTSTKSISSNSQNNAHVLISKNNNINTNTGANDTDKLNVETKNAVNRAMETPAKRKSVSVSVSLSSAGSSPDARSPNHVPRKESASQKSFKMPKRNVTSKVKAMLENDKAQKTKTSATNNVKKIETRKPVNRWDAVMSKISKAQNDAPKVKDVKSKVLNGFNKENVNQKPTSNKLRRTRSRVPESSSAPKLKKMGSIHSSASDLSNASSVKKALVSGKKREVVRVAQVLTTSKISPRSLHKNSANEIKRTPPSYANNDTKTATRRAAFLPKDKKTTPNVPSKDCGKAAIKGGRTSPSVRPSLQSRATHPSAPKTAEALAVLVQHLVFTLDAFRTPLLKKQIDKSRLEIEEAKLACRILEEKLSETNRNHALKIDEEKAKFRSEVAELMEQHRNNITQIHQQHQKKLEILDVEYNKLKQQLIKSHEEQLHKLRSEFNKFQKAHEQTVEILREENDSTREEIDEKNIIIDKLQKYKIESEKLKKEHEYKEQSMKEELRLAHEEIAKLKDENTKAFCLSLDGGKENGGNKFQAVVAEVESLRAVLELKQSEMAELRKALVEANQKVDLLPLVEEKVSALSARCEDLEHQLKLKFVQEQQLINDNKKLQESFREELNHNKRLSQYNEELQWKLQQNKEVVSRVLEQAEETALNRSFLSASFNERHNNRPPQLERTLSFRDHSASNKSNIIPNTSTPYSTQRSKNSLDAVDLIDISPPNSPKVKGVVEKSDSVSYVLEMEESPEMIANRIVRRSFRNPTPPKSTPTKSPANKRPRIKNPLSLSASANALSVDGCCNRRHPDKDDRCRSRSVSVRNGEDLDSSHSDDMFIWNNNSTCSSLNGEYSEMQAISVSYGGDSSLRLESNSDDESTASSSSSGHF